MPGVVASIIPFAPLSFPYSIARADIRPGIKQHSFGPAYWSKHHQGWLFYQIAGRSSRPRNRKFMPSRSGEDALRGFPISLIFLFTEFPVGGYTTTLFWHAILALPADAPKKQG